MNPNPPKYKRILKEALIVIGLAFAVLIFVNVYPYGNHAQESAGSTAEIPEDSVTVVDGKVAQSDFELNFSAEAWYAKFRANKVAFDQTYDKQVLDITGTITSISNDYGCSIIQMKPGTGVFDKMVFGNCSYGKDYWTKEILDVTVGQQVHIRGKYNGTESTEIEMDLTKCHIISD